MRIQDLVEQIGTVGTVPSTAMPAAAPPPAAMTGNTQALNDPKVAASNLAAQKQQKLQQRQAIMAQIAALNRQLADLNRTN
jgi:hypothetical protein